MHRTRSTNKCSPRNGRKTIAIHNTSKKKPRSRLHFTCGRWKPRSARTPSPRPRQIHHNTTQSLQRCFASAKYDSETQPLHNPCCQRRCGNTTSKTSTSHGWRTILVDTNRTTSNTTQTKWTSMHRRIAQCSGRLSHTPTVRLTDDGVGQHCPKLWSRTGNHRRSSSINKQ